MRNDSSSNSQSGSVSSHSSGSSRRSVGSASSSQKNQATEESFLGRERAAFQNLLLERTQEFKFAPTDKRHTFLHAEAGNYDVLDGFLGIRRGNLFRGRAGFNDQALLIVMPGPFPESDRDLLILKQAQRIYVLYNIYSQFVAVQEAYNSYTNLSEDDLLRSEPSEEVFAALLKNFDAVVLRMQNFGLLTGSPVTWSTVFEQQHGALVKLGEKSSKPLLGQIFGQNFFQELQESEFLKQLPTLLASEQAAQPVDLAHMRGNISTLSQTIKKQRQVAVKAKEEKAAKMKALQARAAELPGKIDALPSTDIVSLSLIADEYVSLAAELSFFCKDPESLDGTELTEIRTNLHHVQAALRKHSLSIGSNLRELFKRSAPLELELEDLQAANLSGLKLEFKSLLDQTQVYSALSENLSAMFDSPEARVDFNNLSHLIQILQQSLSDVERAELNQQFTQQLEADCKAQCDALSKVATELFLDEMDSAHLQLQDRLAAFAQAVSPSEGSSNTSVSADGMSVLMMPMLVDALLTRVGKDAKNRAISLEAIEAKLTKIQAYGVPNLEGRFDEIRVDAQATYRAVEEARYNEALLAYLATNRFFCSLVDFAAEADAELAKFTDKGFELTDVVAGLLREVRAGALHRELERLEKEVSALFAGTASPQKIVSDIEELNNFYSSWGVEQTRAVKLRIKALGQTVNLFICDGELKQIEREAQEDLYSAVSKLPALQAKFLQLDVVPTPDEASRIQGLYDALKKKADHASLQPELLAAVKQKGEKEEATALKQQQIAELTQKIEAGFLAIDSVLYAEKVELVEVDAFERCLDDLSGKLNMLKALQTSDQTQSFSYKLERAKEFIGGLNARLEARAAAQQKLAKIKEALNKNHPTFFGGSPPRHIAALKEAANRELPNDQSMSLEGESTYDQRLQASLMSLFLIVNAVKSQAVVASLPKEYQNLEHLPGSQDPAIYSGGQAPSSKLSFSEKMAFVAAAITVIPLFLYAVYSGISCVAKGLVNAGRYLTRNQTTQYTYNSTLLLAAEGHAFSLKAQKPVDSEDGLCFREALLPEDSPGNGISSLNPQNSVTN